MTNLEKLKNLKKVKGFDIEKYDGVRSEIAEVILTDVEKFTYKGVETESQQIIVKTKNVTGDDDFVVQATEYVSLKKDNVTGEYGIPENPNSKAMKMLAYFKAKDFSELVGKDCQVVKRMKGDNYFLGIHFG